MMPKLAAAVTSLSVILGAAFTVDARYATSEQMLALKEQVDQKAQAKTLDNFIFQIKLWELKKLKREAAILSIKEEKTEVEKLHLQELLNEISDLQLQLAQ